MPGNGQPPTSIALSSGVFNTLHGMGYDSQTQAFTSQNVNYFMFVQRDTSSDVAVWFADTDGNGAGFPRGNIPQLTADAIRNGTYDSQTSAVSYQGNNYKFRLERDASGLHVAKAYTV